ncbi:MAG: hypothetical protein A4E57_02487 [Syntrophorhabdaceae bacterium PtaU1.Bin034]|nr:MAG: hypothetical protein A4E57_02487 [Syntrophorhabdaceae bacterium PtaU1.Bin034]
MKSSTVKRVLLLAIILVLLTLNGCANPVATARDLVDVVKHIVREGAERRNETMVNEMNAGEGKEGQPDKAENAVNVMWK